MPVPGAWFSLGFRIGGTDLQTDTKRSTLQEEGELLADRSGWEDFIQWPVFPQAGIASM